MVLDALFMVIAHTGSRDAVNKNTFLFPSHFLCVFAFAVKTP